MKNGKTVTIPKERLIELYVNQNLTATQIAQRFGCNAARVRWYINKYEIKKKEQV